jgi:transposase, IS30 family
LGRRHHCWGPAQSGDSHRSRAGIPLGLCLQGAQDRAKETSAVQLFLFSRLPQLARKSTTLDNGSEHYLHTRLQEELGMQTYFADPYCSWQRGTNESTNGLIRRYFPKRTDFQLVSQEAVNEVVARLNSTPRKVLGYQTPLEVFTAHL